MEIQTMRKILALICLVATAAAAQTPQNGSMIGYPAVGNSSGVIYGTTLTTAATRSCQCFVLPVNKTLSATRTYTATKTGTLGVNDIVMEIFDASSTGRPTGSCASPVASSNTVASAISSATWTRHTGFSYALTAGTQYCACLKNVNGTPGSNNISTAFLRPNLSPGLAGGNTTTQGWYNVRSTDTCSTWDQVSENATFIMLEFNDSSYAGTPIGGGSIADAPSDARVYSSYEVGNYITTSANESRKVLGVGCHMAKVGTPTGGLRFRLYEAGSLVATSGSIATAMVGTDKWHVGYFTSYQLKPSTVYRFVASETTQSDTSSNAFSISKLITEDSAAVRSTMPFGGIQKTVSTNGGSTWTETITDFLLCGMFTDASDELAAASSGGSKKIPLNGGLN